VGTLLYGTADISMTGLTTTNPVVDTVSTTIPTTKVLWFGGYSIVTTTGSPAVRGAFLYDNAGTWYGSLNVVDTVNTSAQSATVRIYYTYTA